MNTWLISIALGEAIAVVVSFILSLFITIVCIAVSGVLLTFRRSARTGLLALGVGMIGLVFGSLNWDVGVGLLIGGTIYTFGVLLGWHRWGFHDPVTALHHPISIGVLVIVGVGALIGSIIMWLILFGALGTDVVYLIVASPSEGVVLGIITLLALFVATSAVRVARLIPRSRQ